ncbi:MAG: SDR family NAD(P)-dependent oxidoreductase [Planctomycetales bacterium]
MNNDFVNKVVLVTGGSRGLGLAIAEAFAASGARIVLAARDEQALAKAVDMLKTKGGDILAVPTDVTVPEQVKSMVAKTVERFGQLDVLVNAAGKSSRGRAAKTEVDSFRDALELNFLAVVSCIQTALPHLTRQHGTIVNVASLAAKVAPSFMGNYPASKFPLVAYSQQLRLELDEVHTLLVCPGPVKRDDAGKRYDISDMDLPESANRPGAGARITAIDPHWLAAKIVKACKKKQIELIVPVRARLLFALGQLWPGFGDWLLRRSMR